MINWAKGRGEYEGEDHVIHAMVSSFWRIAPAGRERMAGLDREDPWVSCIRSQPSYAEEYRQIVDDPISEKIEDLLSGTDTTMMILPISDVLKKDGIFDQLREQGVEITSPPQ